MTHCGWVERTGRTGQSSEACSPPQDADPLFRLLWSLCQLGTESLNFATDFLECNKERLICERKPVRIITIVSLMCDKQQLREPSGILLSVEWVNVLLKAWNEKKSYLAEKKRFKVVFPLSVFCSLWRVI